MASNIENDEGHGAEDEGREARANLSPTRLIEGVRDFMLLNLKQAHMQKPWPQMPEKDQKMWIKRIEERAERLVGDVVDYVATGSFPVVHAKIKNFKVENGAITITANGFADDEVLLTLNHAGPKAIKIIVADGEQFDEERDPLNPDPDQPGLPGVKLHGFDPGFEDEDTPDPLPPAEEPPVENPEGEAADGEEILKPKSDQWRGGFNSRMGGHSRSDNPFNPGAPGHADWFAGWDAGDFDDKAPKLADKPIGEVSDESQQQVDPDPTPEPKPKPRPKAKRTPKAGPVVEPDIDPEDVLPIPDRKPEEPGVEPSTDDGNADGEITDHENVVIESAEQAYEFGKWCRSDGRGTGSNPFEVASDFGKSWLRGYSDQRRFEQANPPGDEF